jgi:glycosyltransferase involved in cell wall biosynthesis
MNRPFTIALVLGLKPEPDYGTSFLKSLFDERDPNFQFVVLASKKSRHSLLPPGDVRFVWDPTWRHPFQIWGWLGKERADLVHLQHEINLFGGARAVLWLPLLLILCKWRRLKVVTTLHTVVPLAEVKGRFSGYFSFPGWRIISWLMKMGLRLSTRAALGMSDAIIVHAAEQAQRLEEDYGGCRDKIHVIPHLELALPVGAHDPGGASPLQDTGPFIDRPFFLFFGYLLRRKGLETLLEAFSTVAGDFPRHVLVIAGETPQKDYERDLRRWEPLKKLRNQVVFTGFLEPKEVAALFKASQFVVLPAVYSFSASAPYAVSLAFEKPVLAPRIGFYRETIADGIDGLLYDGQEAGSFAKALRRMLADQSLRARMSTAIREKRKLFAPSRIARQTLEVYSIVCHGDHLPPPISNNLADGEME